MNIQDRAFSYGFTPANETTCSAIMIALQAVDTKTDHVWEDKGIPVVILETVMLDRRRSSGLVALSAYYTVKEIPTKNGTDLLIWFTPGGKPPKQIANYTHNQHADRALIERVEKIYRYTTANETTRLCVETCFTMLNIKPNLVAIDGTTPVAIFDQTAIHSRRTRELESLLNDSQNFSWQINRTEHGMDLIVWIHALAEQPKYTILEWLLDAPRTSLNAKQAA